MIKKLLAAALVALIPITSLAASVPPDERAPLPARWIVKNDGGGSVQEFISALLEAKRRGMAFKVDGYCASACTLLLAKQLKLDVCVTPKASFMFHQPFFMSQAGIYYGLPYVVQGQQTWDNLFMAAYPPFIVKLITDNGGVPNVYQGAKQSDMFTVGYNELKKNMPTCQ